MRHWELLTTPIWDASCRSFLWCSGGSEIPHMWRQLSSRERQRYIDLCQFLKTPYGVRRWTPSLNEPMSYMWKLVPHPRFERASLKYISCVLAVKNYGYHVILVKILMPKYSTKVLMLLWYFWGFSTWVSIHIWHLWYVFSGRTTSKDRSLH